MVIMRGPRAMAGRIPVSLGGMSPGVKFQRVNWSNNKAALRADWPLPVVRACAAQAMAAKDSE